MKIHLTKKEYRLLLDMLFISEWVMNSRTIDQSANTKPYGEVEQKLLSYAKDFGCDHLISYDKEAGQFFPTQEYETDEIVAQFIDDFEEDSFWDTLLTRLARRDLRQQLGDEKFQEMDPLERLNQEDRIAEKYDEEFVKNGLENLVLKKE